MTSIPLTGAGNAAVGGAVVEDFVHIDDFIFTGAESGHTFTLPSPSPYRHFRLMIVGRADHGSLFPNAYVRLNGGITGYDGQRVTAAGFGIFKWQDDDGAIAEFGRLPSDAVALQTPIVSVIEFPALVGTTFDKRWVEDSAWREDNWNGTIAYQGSYTKRATTAAATTIEVLTTGIVFQAGSTLDLYGIR